VGAAGFVTRSQPHARSRSADRRNHPCSRGAVLILTSREDLCCEA
jgi:hypothetical protein